MANEEHVTRLKQGVDAWNAWRRENPDICPDLRGADLGEANLGEANLRWADLCWVYLAGANLSRANLGKAILRRAILIEADLGGAGLHWADLPGANLNKANLIEANLSSANLSGACLGGAYLMEANLSGADLTGADLSGANLSGAMLVETNLTKADLTDCRIYGISAWRVELKEVTQKNLIITNFNEPEIAVDDIEVAQFVYLLLHNQKIRKIIDTVTSKVVLILGRFTPERIAVLDALREELRQRYYVPIMFDFEKPSSRDTDEAVTLLARMARFVIADITDAKSVLQELRAIAPDLPSVPVQPVIIATQEEPGMFDFYRNRPSFLKVCRYDSQEQLITDLGERVIRPTEDKVQELRSQVP